MSVGVTPLKGAARTRVKLNSVSAHRCPEESLTLVRGNRLCRPSLKKMTSQGTVLPSVLARCAPQHAASKLASTDSKSCVWHTSFSALATPDARPFMVLSPISKQLGRALEAGRGTPLPQQPSL